MGTNFCPNIPVKVVESTFVWKIPNYSFDSIYSNHFSVYGVAIVTIDLIRDTAYVNAGSRRLKLKCHVPILYLSGVPASSRKYFKFMITTEKAGASSYSDYMKILPNQQRFTQSNDRFLDQRNFKECVGKKNCDITLIINVTFKDLPHYERFNENFKLAVDLGASIGDAKLSDYTFEVEGRDFPVFKALLAERSKAFRLIFAENDGNNRSLIENVRAEVFEQLLHFIYTNNIPNRNPHFMSLMAAAHQFEIVELKEICEAQAMVRLNGSNAAGIFQLAHSCDCSNLLKKTSFEVAQKNFSLNKTKLPEHLRNDPGKVKKLFALLAEIDDILKADEAGKNDDETVEVENGTAFIEASKEASESAVDGANSVSDIMDGNEDEVKALIDSEDNVGDNLFDEDGQVDEYAKYSDEEDKIVEPDSKPKLEEFVEFVKNLI